MKAIWWRYPLMRIWLKERSRPWVRSKNPFLRREKSASKSRRPKKGSWSTSSCQRYKTRSQNIWLKTRKIPPWRKSIEPSIYAPKWLIKSKLYTKVGLCSITCTLITLSSKKISIWSSSTLSMLPRRTGRKSCIPTSTSFKISYFYQKIYWKMALLHLKTTLSQFSIC